VVDSGGGGSGGRGQLGDLSSKLTLNDIALGV
jgi:hypothetical protein